MATTAFGYTWSYGKSRLYTASGEIDETSERWSYGRSISFLEYIAPSVPTTVSITKENWLLTHAGFLLVLAGRVDAMDEETRRYSFITGGY